jgi:hypothetical protein
MNFPSRPAYPSYSKIHKLSGATLASSISQLFNAWREVSPTRSSWLRARIGRRNP